MKEKNDEQVQKKRREESLTAAYPGPGLRLSGTDRGRLFHPPGLEKDSPGPETVGDASVFRGLPGNAGHVEPDGDGDAGGFAYVRFGKRCGLRCYTRFSGILESSLRTGGSSLRSLLEPEMEEAFKIQADLARRKGEEASTKLLLPMFGMLGIVMVMVTAPAFFSLG